MCLTPDHLSPLNGPLGPSPTSLTLCPAVNNILPVSVDGHNAGSSARAVFNSAPSTGETSNTRLDVLIECVQYLTIATRKVIHSNKLLLDKHTFFLQIWQDRLCRHQRRRALTKEENDMHRFLPTELGELYEHRKSYSFKSFGQAPLHEDECCAKYLSSMWTVGMTLQNMLAEMTIEAEERKEKSAQRVLSVLEGGKRTLHDLYSFSPPPM